MPMQPATESSSVSVESRPTAAGVVLHFVAAVGPADEDQVLVPGQLACSPARLRFVRFRVLSHSLISFSLTYGLLINLPNFDTDQSDKADNSGLP